MTSMAYQTALMKLRQIYRWDDPYKTAVFCSAYFLLSMTGYLGTGMVRTESTPFVVPQRRLTSD